MALGCYWAVYTTQQTKPDDTKSFQCFACYYALLAQACLFLMLDSDVDAFNFGLLANLEWPPFRSAGHVGEEVRPGIAA